MHETTNDTTSVMFNKWKHHRDFLLEQTAQLADRDKGQRSLAKKLLIIGGSVADIYIGSLPTEGIVAEIIGYLKQSGEYDFEKYNDWIKGNSGYRTIELSDSSCWTLRLGNDPAKYIHIHPGRYSPHTFRIRALTLKTIVATIHLGIAENIKTLSLEDVNRARRMYLDESPLKNVHDREGFGKAFRIITGKAIH